MFSRDTTQPLKEYEPHGSLVAPKEGQREKSLDEIFREAAREGTLHE